MRIILGILFSSLLAAAAQGATRVDLIVYGDYLVTMGEGDGEAGSVIEQGAVAIAGNSIVAVGPRAEIDREYTAARVVPGKGRVLMPGLVNGHTHTSMTLFRGMVDDLDLMTWLNQYVFPLEGQFVDPEFVRIGTELACLEMIRGGTTTFVDMYFYPDVIADVTERCGLRAVVGAPMIDYPSPGFKGWEDSFAAGKAFVSARQGKHERITPAFAPHAPYTVVPEHLEQVLDAAKELNAPISMHLAEAPAETKMIRENYGTTPVAHVEELGMLDHTLIAAHMVQPTKAEIRMLPGNPVGAIHNPTSNLKLAAGIAPVPEMLAAGAKVGLGTDGAASNNDLDLWEEMRLAALLHKARLSDPTVMPAISALRMATSGGAAAIGMGERVGKLAPGMRADMIQVSLENTRLVPLYNVISHLVYAVKSDDVVTTVVSGKVLMENGRVLSMDAGKVRAAARQKAVEIAKAIAAGEKDRSSAQ